MGVSLEIIEQFLQRDALIYEVNDSGDEICVFVPTIRYQSLDDENRLILSIRLGIDGRAFKIVVLEGYEIHALTKGFHQFVLLQVLNILSFRCNLVQFKYIASTRSIHPMVSMVLEDSILTYTQFRQCFYELVYVMEQYHDDIMKTISTKSVYLSRKKDRQLLMMLHLGLPNNDGASEGSLTEKSEPPKDIEKSSTATSEKDDTDITEDTDDVDEWL